MSIKETWDRFDRLTKAGVAVLAAIALFVVGVLIFDGTISDAWDNRQAEQQVKEAAVACELAVEDATAHLEGRKVVPQNQLELGDNLYRASGEVRWRGDVSSYSCTIEYKDDGWNVNITGIPDF